MSLPNPYDCYLVVAARWGTPGFAQRALDYIQDHSAQRYSHAVAAEDNLEETLREVHDQTERKVILVAGGFQGCGHQAIVYLCDDYSKPQAERRVVWIHSLSVGVDLYRFPEIPDQIRGIPITNARGTQSKALAEYVLYAIMYFCRQTCKQLQIQASRHWQPYAIEDLSSRTMGILGYGDIGAHTGRLARAFGMNVRGVKRSAPEAPVDAHGVQLSSGAAAMEAVVKECEFVVNVLPHTPDTVGYFDAERFATMRSDAVYINIGRGGTQVETDLVAALRAGTLRGAALDVFEHEPLSEDSPLYELPPEQILLTHHCACMTAHQGTGLWDRFVELSAVVARGESLAPHEIDREQWY